MIASVPLLLASTLLSNASRVLVIENQGSPASVQIAEDYLKSRHVKNVLKVTCADSALDSGKETMPYADFQIQVEKPLRT